MSDITAQEFREAAACESSYNMSALRHYARLLLSAAEQRETAQHEITIMHESLEAADKREFALKQQIALVREVLHQDLNISRERVLTLEIENQHLQQQIAALTTERNDARHQVMELIAIMDKMGTEV